MKEAIRMVPESIYDSEFPDTSHFRSGRGCHSALRRIKEEWLTSPIQSRSSGTSRWFLEFDIRKHNIDRHRLIPILKEEIDDPKFFYHTQKLLGAGRNIYLHKIDQEIGRIRHKYEITMRIKSVLSQFSGRIDDQAVEEASFNAPQDNEAIFLGRVKSIQRKAAFHSLVSSCHTPPTSTPLRRGDQKTGGAKKTPSGRVPYRALSRWSSRSVPSLFLCAAVPKAEFYCRERNNWAMRDRKISRRGLLIEMGGEARPVIRSERRLARKPLKDHDLIRICYMRYADDLLLGIVGALELLIEIQKTSHPLPTIWPEPLVCRINSNSCTEYEFPGTQEKRLRVKHRIHITACHLRSAIHSQFRNLGDSGRRSLLEAVQLAETLGTAGVRSPQLRLEQGAIGRSLTIGHKCNDPEVVIVYSEDGGRKKGTLGGIFQQRIPHTDRGPYKKDTPKASRSRSH
ncbi:hypothetical protein MKX01_002055 [Papaver californicum]|nr:hypothetical protein MKX01_002055 [Papaver californicum]